MTIKKTIITKNDCYKAGRTITPKGIMIHSTATPGVMAKDWFSRWNKGNLDTAVHAFVDDSVICQHLEWNHRAWHCGSSGNNTHISMELCEPRDWKTNKAYFTACYKNAVELAAYLCQKFSLDANNIISHKEGYKKGVASNHGDPEHWFKHFGVTMDTFRADVKKKLKGTSLSPKEPSSLQKGDQGKKVTDLQKRLNLMKIRLALAFNTLDEDGIFGEKTKEAVRAFQASRNLTVDGIVGEKTATALSYNYGDVTADGKVTADDVLKVLQGVVGEKKLTAKQTKTADMNANGKVDLEDAQAILNQAVKKR